jgi:hypothetical protein
MELVLHFGPQKMEWPLEHSCINATANATAKSVPTCDVWANRTPFTPPGVRGAGERGVGLRQGRGAPPPQPRRARTVRNLYIPTVHRILVCSENTQVPNRVPMPLNGLVCHISKQANSDACPRLTKE